ncbi:hypothetical protein MTR67_028074 [Solanum verrucosum]|nr:hypothetical protein MTR67_028074 [Solanum verrucosum]
MSQQSRR